MVFCIIARPDQDMDGTVLLTKYLGRAEVMLTSLEGVEGAPSSADVSGHPDGSSGGAEKCKGQRQRPVHCHHSSTFVMGDGAGMRPLSLFHMAQRDVQVARISSFNLKLF